MTTTATTTYLSAVVRTPSGPDSVELLGTPSREPGPGEVLVRIAAAAVNPIDLAVSNGYMHAAGLIHQAERTGLGWDFAGTVLAAGPGVSVAVGTRVAGLVPEIDRDFGTFAEQVVVPASDVAVVPDDLDLVPASSVGLNALTAAQLLDMLGAPSGERRLLVTGAAGAVGGYLLSLAPERGWHVSGLARGADESYVRGLGADFVPDPEPGWDAVVDAAGLGTAALSLVRDGGVYLGVKPGQAPEVERGIRVEVVWVRPNASRLAELLARTAAGELPARVRAEYPLTRIADAFRAAAEPGQRGRVVLLP